MKVFAATNELEQALVDAQAGRLSMRALLQVLVDSLLAVPSASEVETDGTGFRPILFLKGGVQMLACFTDKSRIGQYASLATYCLEIKGRDLLGRMPPQCGLVVNPGWSVGFDMPPDGIARLLRDLA